MDINIRLDELTECLIERRTGRIIETEYRIRNTPILPMEYQDWKFDWGDTVKQGNTIYELFIKGRKTVQGRVSLNIGGGVANIDIVESAPHNYSHMGRYVGVGGHLFAIACLCSLEAGCDGVVAFTSKSNLVEYYKQELHAIEVMPRRLVLLEDAAERLIDRYFRK